MPKRILTESLFYSLRLRWERFKLAFSEERLRRQGVEMDVFDAASDDELRDEQGYPSLAGLEAIVKEREDRPAAWHHRATLPQLYLILAWWWACGFLTAWLVWGR